MMKRYLLLLSLMLTSSVVFGQNRSEIRGHVTDQRNANIAGAQAILRSRTGLQLNATSDDNGAFEFKQIDPGEYVLEVRAGGFASFTTSIAVTRGQAIVKDIRLSVEAVNEAVVITATGTAQRIDETSKAISVLDNQTIEAKREIGLSESLRGLPGVRVQQQGSPGTLTNIRVRGLRRSDTAVLFDGLRVRDAADINGAVVSFFPDLGPSDLDRVEVLRGSGSSIYGSNAIGGVINLVPATASCDRHFEFGFDGGSLALFRERFKAAGGLGKRAGFSVGLSRVDVRRGVDGNDEYGDTVGSGRFQFSPTRTSTLSASFYGTDSNARTNDSPFALPAAFTSGQYPRAVEGQTFHADINNPDEGRRNRLLIGALRFSDQVNNVVSYSIAYQHVGSRRRNYNGPQIDPKFAQLYPFGDFAFVAVNNGATDTLDARGNFRLGRHNLATAGLEYELESIFQSSTPSFSSFNNTT